MVGRASKGEEVLSTEFVRYWAGQYDARDEGEEARLKAWLRAEFREGRKYLDKCHFVAIAKWKSPRPLGRYQLNDDTLVREVTALAFARRRDEVRLRLLTLLEGVKVPVASTILHYAFPNRYPIMDVRAVRTLSHFGLWTRSASAEFSVADWQVYVHLMRDHASKLRVTLREPDKALWAFDKQPRHGRS